MKRCKIHEFVVKNEVELLNKKSDAKYRQTVPLFEFNAWPLNKGSEGFSETLIEGFLSYFCLVRKELNCSKDELTIVVQDADGGVGPAAICPPLSTPLFLRLSLAP